MIDITTEDKKYMCLAYLESQHANCIRGKVGAVIVKNHTILGVGNNSIPFGMKPCTEKDCLRKIHHIKHGTHQELCRAVHAEQSAILNALLENHSLKDSTLYTTKFPCTICTRMIIYVGIKRVVYYTPYSDDESLNMLKEAKIEVIHMEPDEQIEKNSPLFSQ